MLRYCLLAVVFMVPGAGVAGQTSADACSLPGVAPGLNGNPEYARVVALARGELPPNSFVQRASELTDASCFRQAINTIGAFVLSAQPADLHTVVNSHYPIDRNNGAMWAGRGVSTALSPGLLLRHDARAQADTGVARGADLLLELSFRPILAFQQNSWFSTITVNVPGYSRHINAGHPRAIDWPQRFGTDAFGTIDPGQSYARARLGHLTLGVATENIWMGPALRYPILMSNTGPGFPHLFTRFSADTTRVGSIDLDLFWGRLAESDHFDINDDNDGRLITGLALSYMPRWTPGLTLGLARLYTSSNDYALTELLGRPYGLSGSATRSIEDNVLFALYGRYALPAAKAEVFVEWAHEAGFSGLTDVLREPDQSQAYTIGFQKLTSVGKRELRLYAEATHLEVPPPLRAGRAALTFYTHGNISQGHTQRGQMLGSWIGPGSDAQIIGLDLIGARSLSGLYVERVRFDADAYYDQWANYYGHNGLDAQLGLGLRQIMRWRGLELSLDASFAHRYNRNFLTLDGSIPGTFAQENNLNFDLRLVWLPGLSR